MKKLLPILYLASVALCPAATTNITPWTAIFKGVDYTSARVVPTGAEKSAAINCLRIDLSDPDVQLLTTPHCTNNCGKDTLAENTSRFLENYGLQVAVNCNFYDGGLGPNDSPLGTADNVKGLAISRGEIVSVPEDPGYTTSILLTTNKQAFFIPNNTPSTNLAGIYTAVSGELVILSGGVNVGSVNTADYQPRTAIGLSQDRRYLFLMTFDGRQGLSFGVNPPWSDGADYNVEADWMQRFGAWDAMNVDGGGSTTMSKADCVGKAIRLNSSSFVLQSGRERYIGHNLGVYARALDSDLKDLAIAPGTTTALITWQTDFDATTQVEYGLTTNYGNATPLDASATKIHIATLTGLLPGSNYNFRALSTAGFDTYSFPCQFSTTTAVSRATLLGLTSAWRYTTNNLDGVGWKAAAYDDSAWSGPSPAILYIDPSVGTFPPRNSLLPPGSGTIFRTYYFRTPFVFTGSTAGLSLTFSNFVDDGAVFYLNGTEIQRLRMAAAPATILNSTYANNTPCPGGAGGDAIATCFDLFTISGSLLNNLVQGTNVLAVEVHNYQTGQDILFGSALFANRTGTTPPALNISMTGSLATLYWNGEGFTLQKSTDLSSPANWEDVPGPVTTSPAQVTNYGTVFYRLRQ